MQAPRNNCVPRWEKSGCSVPWIGCIYLTAGRSLFSAGPLAPSFMPIFLGGPVGQSAAQLAAVAPARAAGGREATSPVFNANVPGLALIPPKLVQKILRGDFVDMHELLPEAWRTEEARDSRCRSFCPKRGLVIDIALWTECYASLVTVLSTKYPDKAPQFMCYLRTIVRTSHNFEGTAWASYDAAYRRQAANRKLLDWATIDPTIYEAFTGRTKLLPRCRYCSTPQGTANTHRETSPRQQSSYAPRHGLTPHHGSPLTAPQLGQA